MTLDEIKETDWYKERPDIIKQAVEILPPMQLYRVKSTGQQVSLYSYHEAETIEEVTVTVVKTGKGGPLGKIGLGEIEKGQGVFGYKLTDLEPWKDE